MLESACLKLFVGVAGLIVGVCMCVCLCVCVCGHVSESVCLSVCLCVSISLHACGVPFCCLPVPLTGNVSLMAEAGLHVTNSRIVG